jgi:hypothetical protein
VADHRSQPAGDSRQSPLPVSAFFQIERIYLVHAVSRILSPIGQRRGQVPTSKGKRKRTKIKHLETPSTPPQPAISSYLTIGLNTTVRTLSAQIPSETDPAPSHLPPLHVVFVFVANKQLAQLPVLANLAHPKVQLILFHQPAAEKAICDSLGLPRVGALGVRADASGAEPLFACIADIPNIKVPFLKESTAGVWLGTKIAASNQERHELLAS